MKKKKTPKSWGFQFGPVTWPSADLLSWPDVIEDWEPELPEWDYEPLEWDYEPLDWDIEPQEEPGPTTDSEKENRVK